MKKPELCSNYHKFAAIEKGSGLDVSTNLAQISFSCENPKRADYCRLFEHVATSPIQFLPTCICFKGTLSTILAPENVSSATLLSEVTETACTRLVSLLDSSQCVEGAMHANTTFLQDASCRHGQRLPKKPAVFRVVPSLKLEIVQPFANISKHGKPQDTKPRVCLDSQLRAAKGPPTPRPARRSDDVAPRLPRTFWPFP